MLERISNPDLTSLGSVEILATTPVAFSDDGQLLLVRARYDDGISQDRQTVLVYHVETGTYAIDDLGSLVFGNEEPVGNYNIGIADITGTIDSFAFAFGYEVTDQHGSKYYKLAHVSDNGTVTKDVLASVLSDNDFIANNPIDDVMLDGEALVISTNEPLLNETNGRDIYRIDLGNDSIARINEMDGYEVPGDTVLNDFVNLGGRTQYLTTTRSKIDDANDQTADLILFDGDEGSSFQILSAPDGVHWDGDVIDARFWGDNILIETDARLSEFDIDNTNDIYQIDIINGAIEFVNLEEHFHAGVNLSLLDADISGSSFVLSGRGINQSSFVEQAYLIEAGSNDITLLSEYTSDAETISEAASGGVLEFVLAPSGNSFAVAVSEYSWEIPINFGGEVYLEAEMSVVVDPIFVDESQNEISNLDLSLIGGTDAAQEQMFNKQLQLHVDKGANEVVSFSVTSSSKGNVTISEDGLVTYHGAVAFDGSDTVEIGLLKDGQEVDTLTINVTGYPVSSVDLDNGNALVFFSNVHPPHGVDAIAGGDTSGIFGLSN